MLASSREVAVPTAYVFIAPGGQKGPWDDPECACTLYAKAQELCPESAGCECAWAISPHPISNRPSGETDQARHLTVSAGDRAAWRGSLSTEHWPSALIATQPSRRLGPSRRTTARRHQTVRRPECRRAEYCNWRPSSALGDAVDARYGMRGTHHGESGQLLLPARQPGGRQTGEGDAHKNKGDHVGRFPARCLRQQT